MQPEHTGVLPTGSAKKAPKGRAGRGGSPSLSSPKMRVMLRSLSAFCLGFLLWIKSEIRAWMAIQAGWRNIFPIECQTVTELHRRVQCFLFRYHHCWLKTKLLHTPQTIFRVIYCHTTSLHLQLLQSFLPHSFICTSASPLPCTRRTPVALLCAAVSAAITSHQCFSGTELLKGTFWIYGGWI